MNDLVFLLMVVAFFALAIGLVRACEHIIGPDEPGAGQPSPAVPASATSSEVAAR